jgi:outer membrane phospholipase A
MSKVHRSSRVSWTHARLSASQEFYSMQFDTSSKQMYSCLFPVSRPDLHIDLSVQMATESFGWWLVSQYDSSAFLSKWTSSRTNHTRKPDTQLAVSRDPKWRLSNTLRLDKNINITIVTYLTISWWASYHPDGPESVRVDACSTRNQSSIALQTKH